MKSVVFTFGRMNPPTTGHQLLVNKLLTLARTSKSTPRVYLSHSVGKKDPLQYDKKLSFARAAFGAIVRKSNSKNIIQILKELEAEKFTYVTMVVGSDRVDDFTKLLNTYNGKEYTFEKIDVKSAGERDPDADDVSGMSASKMRALAKDEKVAEFMRGAPNTLKAAQAKSMYTAVRKALLGEDVMEYGHDEKFLEFIFESNHEDDDISDLPSDSEITKHFDSLSPDDLDLDDSDAMMLDVLLGNDEEEEEIKEARVLSIQQRQKLGQRMKAMSKRLARLRQIKAKQMPAQQRLRMRARKAAIMLLRKRATGRKNLDYAALSKSQRVAVDTALVQRFGKNLNSLVSRLATRLMPRVRKHAQDYVKQSREEVKEQTIDPKTKKHVPDQAKDSPLNIDATKLNILTTDPQKNDRVAPDPKQAHLHKNKKATHFFKTFDEGRKSSADKDARDAGDTNIIYQMRKTINSRGEHETVFADGHKAQISIADAKKLIAKFEALRMPADKQEFTIQAGKSLSSFRNVLAHGVKQEKKKISLGGRNFKEFYLGVGRSRTVSAYDNDEPPGTRRVAEAKSVGGVEPDANDDPNVSRKPNPKLDLLLRLGLADTDELQKYRRALRSSKKQALGSPEMRKKLADLLDKLIDIVTGDPSTYSRVRYKVQAQEAISLVNKAEKSGVDVTILAEVFMREIAETNDNHRAFNRVNSFIAGGKAVEMDGDLAEKVDLPYQYRAGLSDKTAAARKSHFDKANKLSDRDPRAYEPAPGDATAKTKTSKHTLKYKKMYGEESINEGPSDTGLAAKAKKSGVSLGTLRKVYRRGVAAWNSGHRPGTTPQQWGMARVNSYITKGKGTYHGADKDLREEDLDEKGPGLWANIHAKRARIKAGSGERMRKPGSKGAPTADQIRAAKSEETQNEGQANWAKARKENERSSVAYLNRAKKSYVDRSVTPYKADDAKIAADSMKAFLAKGGKIQQVPSGKKTIKSYVKPKKYMTPNQASRVTEQNMTTHDAVPLSKRVKRVKSFHAFHPPVKEAVQRDADIKMIKVRMPDGSLKFRKERAPTAVQREMYTGSEPTTGNMSDPANRFVGTNSIRQNYASVTPGQGAVAGEIAVAKFAPEKVDYSSSMAKKTRTEVDQSKDNLSKKHLSDIRKALGGIRESHDLNEAFAAGFQLAPFARDYGITIQSAFEHHPDVENMMNEYNTKTTKAIVYKNNKPFAMYPDMKAAQKEYYGKDGYSIGTVSLSKSKALKKANPGLKIVEDSMDEATYQGRKVPLNKPMAGDVKKSKVFVDPDGDGKAKKINFGDKKLSIKKDQPARKRSYCARSSGQGNLKNKASANYWSRRAWDC